MIIVSGGTNLVGDLNLPKLSSSLSALLGVSTSNS